MKNILLPFCIACSLTLYIAFNKSENKTGDQTADSKAEMESPMDFAMYQQLKYADPATGRVPAMGLFKAQMELAAKGKMNSPFSFLRNNSRTAQWAPVNDNFASLAVTHITYDPNNTQTYYFCTGEGWYNADASIGAGVWKSTDAGQTWNHLSSTDTSLFQYCQDIAVHPMTGDVYVATKTGGLMRSQNGGVTFKKVLGNGGFGATKNSACDIEFTRNGSIFCTLGIFEVGGIYFSNAGDSGTWAKQITGLPSNGYNRIELATAKSNDNVAYAVIQNSGTLGIKGFYKTTNKGVSWDTIPNPGGNLNWAKKQAWYDLTVEVDPNNENVVVAGGFQLWRSQNGGNTWMQLSHGKLDSLAYQYVHVDQHEIVFQSSDTVYFGNDGGIWRSVNFTSPFPDIYDKDYGYRVTQFYALDISPVSGSPVIIGGTQDNGSPGMLQNGISPYKSLSGADGAYCAVNYNNPLIFYTTKNSNGTFRINDGGVGGTRDTITNRKLTDNDVQFINSMEMDPNDPNTLYMASSKGLWRLKNANTAFAIDSAWEKASVNYGAISAIGISKNIPNIVFIGQTLNGNIGRVEGADTSTATHAVINCDPANMINNGYVNCIYVDPLDAAHVFVVLTNFGIKNIYESHDALSASPTWYAQDGDLPDLPVNWIFPHPMNDSICYIGTDLGVFYTNVLNDDSTIWLTASTGLPNVRVTMFAYRSSDNKLVCSTHGRGMFECTLPTGPNYDLSWTERGPLDVGGRTQTIMIDPNDPSHKKVWAGSVSGGLWVVDDIDVVPSVTRISDIIKQPDVIMVAPNPVGYLGSTISFYGEGEKTNVFIYNISGELVQTIWNSNPSVTGLNKISWKPSSNLFSGTYFILIEENGKKKFKKIVVMK